MKSIKMTARNSGFLYLLVAITGFFSHYVNGKLIMYGDPSATVSNIIASERLFRFGLISDFLMITFWILLALMLCKLFRPVNKHHALLMVSFVLVGSAIVCIASLNKFTALLLLKDAHYSMAFGTNQLESLVMLFFDLSQIGQFISCLFFGLWLFPLSLLVLKSHYFPKNAGKIICILLIIAGLGYITDFFTFFLLPNLNMTITQFTFFGEVLLLLWLLIKGVKVPQIKSNSKAGI